LPVANKILTLFLLLHSVENALDYPKKPVRGNPIISAHQVRLIDENGAALGIFLLREAQEMAQQRGLDLIEVAPDASPPVCKIADYGRLRYAEQKKKTEMRKKQKITLLKEIQLRPNIQEHDYQVKLSHAIGFLQNRDKVKLTLQFRGREVAFADAGRKVIERIIADLSSVGKVESPPKLEGRRIIGIISPLRAAEMEGSGA
jgi:translation initiation factor IF-3